MQSEIHKKHVTLIILFVMHAQKVQWIEVINIFLAVF